jgi:hypothetical protein
LARIQRRISVLAKDDAATRQVVEQPNLSVQQTHSMGLLGISAGDPRADARDVVEDFIDRVEAIITLKH